MQNILLIGDVHTKIEDYYSILKENSKLSSIQLGDFGFKKEHENLLNNIDTKNHKILFGNHDYYPMIDSSYSLGHFGIYQNIFYIRGAYSIDKVCRKEGIDWFPNEELTYKQCVEAFDLYCKIKPEIVISHDCPDFIRSSLFDIPYQEGSITSQLLEQMFDFNKPKAWYFGHHHYSITDNIKKCKFQCLNELETIII